MTSNEMYWKLKSIFGKTIPDDDLRYKAGLAVEINRLKEEMNAVILGHNYMDAVLYNSIPDFVGDSLELSRLATRIDKDIIVFCGVEFMAETAKILNPSKTVLLPAEKAGCSLAESITGEDVRQLKQKYPGVPVVSYVNTYAEVKAESDLCCTSGNAAAVVESLKEDTIIFLPDEFLARNIANLTGKHIIFPTLNPSAPLDDNQIDFQMIGWRGRCEVHEQFTVQDIETARQQYPGVVVLSHPECSPEVVAASDITGSTSLIIQHVAQNPAPHYLVLTESAMNDNLAAAHPDKDILTVCRVRCPHMEHITLESVLDSLQNLRKVIEVPEDIRNRAYRAVERMISIH